MRYAALLALLVLLAGCAGSPGLGSPPADETCHTATSTTSPMSTSTGTPTATPHVEVQGDGQRLSVNATAVWLRVLKLRGIAPTAISAPVVRVGSANEQTFSKTELDRNTDRFSHLIGLNENQSEPVTLTTPDGYVAPPQFTDGNYTRVNMGIAEDDSPTAVEATLAHEYVHVIQVETDFCLTDEELTEVQASVSPSMFADVREGAAEYVADVYATRYLTGVSLQAERQKAYEQARPNAWKLSRGGYYFGYRHVAARVASPQQLPTVYEAPPETEEQLIHGLRPSSEPPVALSVQAGGGWHSRGTVGELQLRVALTEHLPESRAAAAAAGWGNDTLLQRSGNYVWVVRMDDEANASELKAALDRHVEGVTETADPIDRPTDIAYRVVRIDAETLALVVGEPAFVEAVRIATDSGSVAVAAETAQGSKTAHRRGSSLVAGTIRSTPAQAVLWVPGG